MNSNTKDLSINNDKNESKVDSNDFRLSQNQFGPQSSILTTGNYDD
jgi:hypothetical protein